MSARARHGSGRLAATGLKDDEDGDDEGDADELVSVGVLLAQPAAKRATTPNTVKVLSIVHEISIIRPP